MDLGQRVGTARPIGWLITADSLTLSIEVTPDGAVVHARRQLPLGAPRRSHQFGTLTLEVTIGSEQIRLATVTFDAETGLYETYIGLPFRRSQPGRIDSSQERAVRKAEDFLIDKLQRLL